VIASDDTLADVGAAAESKAGLVDRTLPGSLVHSAMAGASVGLGLVRSSPSGRPSTGLARRCPASSWPPFGVALSLVLAAGSDPFTGRG